MLYSYEARNSSGQIVTGSLEALDERTAARHVRELGHFPTRVVRQDTDAGRANVRTEDKPSFLKTFVLSIWSGVSPIDLAVCYRQWGTLLGSGVPILRGLTTLANTQSRSLRQSLQSIAQTVQNGGTVSEGMTRFPWIYTEFHRAMVRSGEMTGGLDTTFRRLADALEQEVALRRSLRRELTYPKFVVASAFLLPPLFYLFLGGVGEYLRHAVLPLLALCGIGAGFFLIDRLGAQYRKGYDAFTANLPGVGGTVRLIALARFARIWSSLYAAGVGIGPAIRLAADACGNAYLGSKIAQAIPAIESGEGFTTPLNRTGAFPGMVITMIGTGEETGDLDAMLDKVADHFEQDAAVRLHQTAIAIGTGVLIIIGILVGMMVIQFYTGYFTNLLKPE